MKVRALNNSGKTIPAGSLMSFDPAIGKDYPGIIYYRYDSSEPFITIEDMKIIERRSKMELQMNEELVATMAKISPEMALWSSVIHWWELMGMRVEDAAVDNRSHGENCGLCCQERDGCDACVLKKATGVSCHQSGSLYKAATATLLRKDQEAWEISSRAVFDALLSLAISHPEPKKEVFYRVGDMFKGPLGRYILTRSVHVGLSKPTPMVFVNLSGGEHWSDPRNVADPHRITEEEFKTLCYNENFERISNDKS